MCPGLAEPSFPLYIEISAHFGIQPLENLVANRFINRYGETDYYLCQILG